MSYRSLIAAALLCTACQYAADKTVTTIVQNYPAVASTANSRTVVQQNDAAVVSYTADTLTEGEYSDAWQSAIYQGCMH